MALSSVLHNSLERATRYGAVETPHDTQCGDAGKESTCTANEPQFQLLEPPWAEMYSVAAMPAPTPATSGPPPPETP